MAKVKSQFVCQSCGNSSPKWLGKCSDCGGWNTFSEEIFTKSPSKSASYAVREGFSVKPLAFADIDVNLDSNGEVGGFRFSSSVAELDRVLGGGLVPGSAVLIGGDPGIGKSTLLLQSAVLTARAGLKVLYVTGEESAEQIRLRAERVAKSSKGLDGLFIWPETAVSSIVNEVKNIKPDMLIIDSVQTMYSMELDSSPGTVGQVRESSATLINLCKSIGTALILVGHVTKDGSIAGPRVLEHMVDTVLYFEGDRSHSFRILRAVKNRFGSVLEIGVFEMTDEGLREVSNPSELFLPDEGKALSGSAIVANLEGTRTLFVEIQCLVAAAVFPQPRRTTEGVDINKLMLVGAVLEKKAGISLASHDIFVKAAGGIKLTGPAIDLGLAMSLVSAFYEKPLTEKTVFIGELGLSGELRSVSHVDKRVGDAASLGFNRAIVPKGNLKALKKIKGIEVTAFGTIREVIDGFFKK